jgi:hypothetical protein
MHIVQRTVKLLVHHKREKRARHVLEYSLDYNQLERDMQIQHTIGIFTILRQVVLENKDSSLGIRTNISG